MGRRKKDSNADAFVEVAAAAAAVLPEKSAKGGKRRAEEPVENPAAAKKQKKKVVMEVPQQKEEEEKKKRRKKKQKNVPAEYPPKKNLGIGGSEGSTLLESSNEVADHCGEALLGKSAKEGKRQRGQTMDNLVTASAKKQRKEVAKEVQKKDDDEENVRKNQKEKFAKEESEQKEGEEDKKKQLLKVHIKSHPKKKQDIGSLGKATLLESLMETVASANKKLPSMVPSNRLANPAGVKRREKRNTSSYKKDICHHEEEPFGNQREFFKDVGRIVDVRVATFETGKYQGRPRGFCHVEFASEDAVQKALELNGEQLLGRQVKLHLAHKRADYATEELLGRPMKLDLALEGVDCAPEEILGRSVKLDLACDSVECTPECRKDDYSHQNGGNDQTQTVLVYGLDKSHDEDQIQSSLQEHFGSCGKITRVLIPKDYETGAPRGFAYIDFEGRGNLPKALRLNGSSLDSYTLTVEEVGCSSVRSRGPGGDHGESTDTFDG